jgi:hypothetical protein
MSGSVVTPDDPEAIAGSVPIRRRRGESLDASGRDVVELGVKNRAPAAERQPRRFDRKRLAPRVRPNRHSSHRRTTPAGRIAGDNHVPPAATKVAPANSLRSLDEERVHDPASSVQMQLPPSRQSRPAAVSASTVREALPRTSLPLLLLDQAEGRRPAVVYGVIWER